ncbi:hypothetical protein BHM03_00021201 [Ensete ventricosum]|nr:hypothetical protein BHM03_00021201 [Ensete ventricosum]
MEKPSFSLLAVDTKLTPQVLYFSVPNGPHQQKQSEWTATVGGRPTTEHLTYDDSLQRGMQAEDEKGGARTPHLSIHVGIEYASTRR